MSALFDADNNRDELRAAFESWETDPVQAFRSFLAFAEAGSVWSMLQVANAYWAGRGVAQDINNAEKWARLAYEKGSDVGLVDAARFAGLRGDIETARTLLEEGACRLLARSITDLGCLEVKVGRKIAARQRLEQAAGLGDIRARLMLARAMAFGKFGLRAVPEGFRSFKQLAGDVDDIIRARTPA